MVDNKNPGRFGPIPVRSGPFRPGSFRPDFWGESFRPSWGGSFRPDFWGESFRPDLFIVGKQVRY